MRGLWAGNFVAWVIVAALLPVAAALVLESGPGALARFFAALVVVLFWQAVFLVARAQPPSPSAVVTALLFAVLAPGELALWQIVLAVTFGAVIGEQVFGGWGRNVVSPATTALAFAYFAFPEVAHPGAGVQMALAAAFGAGLLVLAGVAAASVLASFALGLAAAAVLLGGEIDALARAGSLAVGLVFLVADPVASASTRWGRWIYGALAGALAGLFGFAGAGIDNPQSIVMAALVASLFAPLIDAGVIAATMRVWRRSDG